MIAWIVLLLSGLLEAAWSHALARAGGLRRPLWSLAGVGLALVSLVLLAIALRDLPVSVAYAVWVGVGTVAVVTTGAALHGERLTLRRAACLGLILAGVVGLSLGSS